MPALPHRLVLVVLVVLSLASLAACDDTTAEQDEPLPNDTSTSDTGAQDTASTDTGGQDTAADGEDDTAATDTDAGPDTTVADTSGSDTSDASDTSDVVDHGEVTALEIRPALATLEVLNGVVVPRDFAAFAIHEDGFEREVTSAWRFDRFELAGVDASGLLTPTGSQGGEGVLTATWGALEATTTVRIMLRETVNEAGLSAAEQALFASPDAQPSGTLLYPYDETVFARGILGPEIQWDGGQAGDRYLVQISEAHMLLEYYVLAEPPSAFTLPAETWTRLTQTNAGEPVEIAISRLSADGQAHQAMTQQWHIAQGSLKGTIYYWAVNQGRLMKITPGGGAPEPVFDSGPADQLGTPAPANYDGTVPPWTVGSGDKRCVSCHTVSRNGNAVAAVFETKGSAPSPWGLIDLTAQPEPQLSIVSDYLDDTIWVALNPDASWAVSNKASFDMELVDTATNTIVASALDDAADNLADPAFSPDGRHLAFASHVTGAYPVEFWRSDLDVMDFDAVTGELTNRRQVIAGGTETIAFPSFTPDSKWVLYQRGDYSRAKYGGDKIGHDNLYMADVAAQVGELRLDNLNGEAYLPAHNHDLNYEPRVNPIAVGGYAWVVFMSPRDYGHRMRSTSNPTYENRKQLWVAAIDLNPQPGEDPSHPGFWLPGQDLSTINMSGYWALDPCKAEGEGCEAGFECCTGYCQDDGSGQKVCVPPTGLCSEEGEACASDADCCNDGVTPLVCLSGFCGLVPN